MLRKPPFLKTVTFYEGLSRSAFKRLSRATKRAVMIEWFYENYEDPVHETPYDSREGGYQYIWGGPYDAREEIYDMFGGTASEDLIDEIIEEVQSDGIIDWAPVDKGDRRDSDDEPPTPPSLESIEDVPGPAYGTDEERAVRRNAIMAVERLNDALNASAAPAVGIGHNQPPEPIEDGVSARLKALRPTVQQLQIELHALTPSIPVVKKLAATLGSALGASGIWAAKKVDMMVDAAAKTTGNLAAIALVAAGINNQILAALKAAYDAVVGWLATATLPF